jgi:hypothetical protein
MSALSLSDRLFAFIVNWLSLGGHEYGRAHWGKCGRPGIDPVALPTDELSAVVALAPFLARPALPPCRTLTVMLIQGHGLGARDKPAPSACVSSGQALATKCTITRAPAAASTSAWRCPCRAKHR